MRKQARLLSKFPDACGLGFTDQLLMQAKMQTVNRSMVSIVGALERSLAGNNLERMAEVRLHMQVCTCA